MAALPSLIFNAPVTTVVNAHPITNGTMYKIQAITLLNLTAAVGFLQIFNMPAAEVTLGTTVPVVSIGYAASGQLILPFSDRNFMLTGTGFSIACTTTALGASTASTQVNIWF